MSAPLTLEEALQVQAATLAATDAGKPAAEPLALDLAPLLGGAGDAIAVLRSMAKIADDAARAAATLAAAMGLSLPHPPPATRHPPRLTSHPAR